MEDKRHVWPHCDRYSQWPHVEGRASLEAEGKKQEARAGRRPWRDDAAILALRHHLALPKPQPNRGKGANSGMKKGGGTLEPCQDSLCARALAMLN